jgi:translation initiation factor 1
MVSRVSSKGGASGFSSLVYSTDSGRVCPGCGAALATCVCKARAAAANIPSGDAVRVSRDSKSRGGKTVTVVRGLPLLPDELAALGKRLRSACGAGGTAKDGVLEVQGDHVDKVLQWLQAEGYAAKRSGG